MTSGAPVVVIKSLSYRYGTTEQAFWALRDLSLTICEGEFVAITGASGSGKSTLMNLLGTLATSGDGSLEFSGQNTAELSGDALAVLRNRQIGFVFQQFHLLPRLSVLANVMLPVSYIQPRPLPHERDEFIQRALTLMTRLGIADQADKLPATLSGGQKQRVAIARALLMNPAIILADEPTGALDSRTSAEVLKIFAELNEEGRTVIVITHDGAVAKVARRRIELKDGKVTADEAQPGLSHDDVKDALPQVTAASVARQRTPGFAWLRQKMAPLADAWQALFSSKLRTALTSLGLIIGVSSITILLTLGAAAQEVILGIFNQAGTDRIYVGLDYQAARTNTAGYWPGIDVVSELPAIQATFAPYGRIVPLGGNSQQNAVAAGNNFEVNIQTLFSLSDFNDTGAKITDGRMIAPHEFAEGARVALIGSDFAAQMWPNNYTGRLANRTFPIGEQISLRGALQTSVTVVGVVGRRDTIFEATDINGRIYVPMSTSIRYTGQRLVTWIAVVPGKGVEQRWLADSIVNYLRIRTGLKYPFRAHVPEEFIGRIMLFIRVFQALTALVGGLCIVVGGIGIMNIMLVTIAERIKEIGLRKALGASGPDIVRQFLFECIMLCTASGLVGTILGSLFCNAVALIGHAALPDTIPGKILLNPTGIFAGLGTAIACGLMFGMMPALKASRLDPSEALRSE